MFYNIEKRIKKMKGLTKSQIYTNTQHKTIQYNTTQHKIYFHFLLLSFEYDLDLYLDTDE